MKNENFITIQGWMVNELKLSGNELICYAIIYGFSQDKNFWEGSLTYMAEWLNVSRRTAINIINSLCSKGYIEKQDYEVNNVKFCKYRAIALNFIGGEKIALGGGENFSPCIYNIDNNKEEIDKSISKKETINYSEIQAQWKKINPNLKQPRIIDDKRKQAIRALLKNNNATIADLYRAFQMISVSSYCNANHERNRTWKATFDWLINNTQNCFNRLLEGQFASTDLEKEKAEKISNGEWEEQDARQISSSSYHPYGNTAINYSEQYQCYISIDNFNGTLCDGYTDDNRPDGAFVRLNNARGTITWSKADRKWIHKK